MERLKIRTAAATMAAGLASVALPAAALARTVGDFDKLSGTWVGGDNSGCYDASDWSNC